MAGLLSNIIEMIKPLDEEAMAEPLLMVTLVLMPVVSC